MCGLSRVVSYSLGAALAEIKSHDLMGLIVFLSVVCVVAAALGAWAAVQLHKETKKDTH